MTTIWSTLWLRKASVSAQVANETNLCVKESWTVRTRNGGASDWYGSAFSKFPAQLSCCITLQTFALNLTTSHHFSVLHQIFQAMEAISFHGDLQCVFEVLFLASFGALALRQFTVEQSLQAAVIFHADHMTGPTKLWLHQDGIDAWKRSSS